MIFCSQIVLVLRMSVACFEFGGIGSPKRLRRAVGESVESEEGCPGWCTILSTISLRFSFNFFTEGCVRKKPVGALGLSVLLYS